MLKLQLFGNIGKGLVTTKSLFNNRNPRPNFYFSSRIIRSSSSSSSSVKFPKAMASEEENYMFGPYKIHLNEVFYSTKLSFAMVNLRPLLPGHVLVCPRREVKRFVDLTSDETSDLWLTAQKIGGTLEHHHKASSLTFTIQDGPHAGQTVPHVHIHILPRAAGDFEKNDEIYDALDEKEKELKQKLDLDKERKDRSYEDMAQEAAEYRKLFS
ncbi:bifunctional bis(5'-adenosyl)-triphosphatase/adenylylsulfatase FHIT-like isoform X2 [Papaver somniferum]|uniref:bifunctional bis(5'-adenosyl)-triphosphatase/adenylylsulfatase FHIT-like isoform X2 n=1 Tax=Papaver somniferum TaxID=3469 RepID=UPI000E6FE20B|nr:bifunctional bis(5'-adenosyl)-triphosphatase/adenylylsulfatase FHIT-like isoform X2 [Papaver somniferum]